MPIYEYRCGACGHGFEALLQRSDEAAPQCPKCGAAQSEKQPSVFVVTHGAPPAPAGPCGSADCACRRH